MGGGIAGASAGYFLADHGRVTLVEAEEMLGFHSTGRSAALFSEYYGITAVRALTAASRSFLVQPPPGFSDHPLLTPRGTVMLATPGSEHQFGTELAAGQQAPEPAREITPAQAAALCPVLRPAAFTRVMLKPATMDIDVAALHQGFLRGLRARGGRILTRARVIRLDHRRGCWHARTGAADITAPVLVNAAGAWADQLAALAGLTPAGLVPRRRTAFLTGADAGLPAPGWPMVADVAETFYFKPESGALLVSPADTEVTAPGHARPDDLEIARAADRVQHVTTLRLRRIRRAWAGLRSAPADGLPVAGADPAADGFVWSAGLGGTGIQTAPAIGLLTAQAAAAALGTKGPDLARLGPSASGLDRSEPIHPAPNRAASPDPPALPRLAGPAGPTRTVAALISPARFR